MEFYKTALKYLKQCEVQFSKSFVRSRMLSHPDYPSLVSFTDTLDEMRLPYSAVIADKQKYSELKYPLLAHYKQDVGDNFLLVSSADQFKKGDRVLLEKWDGIAVMVESRASVDHEEHTECLLDEKRKGKRFFVAACCFAALLIGIAVYNFTASSLALMLLSIAGIASCGLIILYSMGKDNAITNQLCSADGAFGCDKVLHSKAAVLWKGVGLGDVGLMYFTGVAIFLALSVLTHSTIAAFSLLVLPFVLSTVFSAFSLWYQWKVVKKWCKMCLIVIAVLWLHSIIFFNLPFPHFTVDFLMPSAILFLVSQTISSIAWLTIKPLILEADKAANTAVAVLKWKRDPDVFLALLSQQRQVNASPWEDDIVLGNPHARVQLIVACGTYCNPCAGTHKLLENLVKWHPDDLGLTIRFSLSTTSVNDKRIEAVTNILEAFDSSLQPGHANPVDNWFKWMDIEKYKKAYGIGTNTNAHQTTLEKHIQWSGESKIKHTPSIFINGYEIPNKYGPQDLALLINHLNDNISQLAAVANARL